MDPSPTGSPSEDGLLRLTQVGLLALLLVTLGASLCGLLAQGFLESHVVKLFDDLEAPIHLARYVKIGMGSIAIVTVLGLMTVELWVRRGAALRHRGWLFGLAGATTVLAVTVAVTVAALWLPTEAQAEAQRLIYSLDALAALLLLLVIGVNVSWQEATRWPSWIWTAIALLFIAALLIADTLGGDILGTQGRLLVAGFPACFGLAWTIWHRDSAAPSPIANRGTLLGAFLVMLGAPYLIALMYTDGEPYVIRAMYYITVFAFMANILVMLAVGARLLVQATPDARATHALVVVGLFLMFMSLLPDYAPSWSSEHRHLFHRIGFDPNQGAPAIFMILLAASLQFLTRRDPQGGPPKWIGFLWLALLCLFLIAQWYATFQGHYDIRVLKVQDARLELRRTRVIHLVEFAYALSLLPLLPSAWRVCRDLLRPLSPPRT